MSARVQVNSVVTISYILTDDQGNEIEARTPEEPAVYIHGHGQLLPALEDALDGKTPGFSTGVHVKPDQAYGEYQPDLVVEMPRDSFPQSIDLKVGMKFNTQGPSGQPMTVRVTEFDEKTVTVDGNHPLAGVPLNFEIKILEIRSATPEEKKTGVIEQPRREYLH
jgi:FKBP-type peptidyl-prolyl cis-trans isomerase SlyD